MLNSATRLAYGVGGLLAPRAMASARLAADTQENPQARLFVRGFSAHQILVAAIGLAALQQPRLERPALLAAIAIDASDIVSAIAEVTERNSADQDLAGGAIFSGAGIATALAAHLAPA